MSLKQSVHVRVESLSYNNGLTILTLTLKQRIFGYGLVFQSLRLTFLSSVHKGTFTKHGLLSFHNNILNLFWGYFLYE